MPSQEIFFSQKFGERQIEVLKTYDSTLAREAFQLMGDEAKEVLAQSLIVAGALDAQDLPFADDDLWQGIEEGAREEWNAFSYFVVREGTDPILRPVFISSDWPTAERFARLQGGVVIETHSH